MTAPIDNLRVLLIQVREAPEVAEHERRCVVEQSGLEPSQIQTVNVALEATPSPDRAAAADAVIIGGAGSHSACNDDAFTPAMLSLVRALHDRRVPMLGCCWGHQFIARALGGEVIHDPAKAEIGTVEVSLTDDGARDGVLGGCPRRFVALAGHEDRVSRLPAGAVELARSAGNPNQAFRITGTLTYGTQFHSELTPERLIERLSVYRHYMPDDSEFESLKRSIRPTPDASRVLGRFLKIASRSSGR